MSKDHDEALGREMWIDSDGESIEEESSQSKSSRVKEAWEEIPHIELYYNSKNPPPEEFKKLAKIRKQLLNEIDIKLSIEREHLTGMHSDFHEVNNEIEKYLMLYRKPLPYYHSKEDIPNNKYGYVCEPSYGYELTPEMLTYMLHKAHEPYRLDQFDISKLEDGRCILARHQTFDGEVYSGINPERHVMVYYNDTNGQLERVLFQELERLIPSGINSSYPF